MLRLLKPAILLAGALILPSAAVSQESPSPPCAPYADVVKNLGERFQEIPIAAAIPDNAGSTVIILFSSPDGETWTVVEVAAATRIACLILGGTDWQPLVPEPTGDPV